MVAIASVAAEGNGSAEWELDGRQLENRSDMEGLEEKGPNLLYVIAGCVGSRRAGSAGLKENGEEERRGLRRQLGRERYKEILTREICRNSSHNIPDPVV